MTCTEQVQTHDSVRPVAQNQLPLSLSKGWLCLPFLITPQRPQHWQRGTRALLSVELVFMTEPWSVPS